MILQTIIACLILVNHLGKTSYYVDGKLYEHARIHKQLNKSSDQVNIHLFPHSHTDVGWLKTIDEYLYGQRSNSGQLAGNATQTLNSVVSTLLTDKKYKFVWAEQAFFTRWYMNQNEKVKQAVRYLIKNKQFSLVGGGWVVNDEACPYYEDIIDQLTVGHQFLDTYLDFQPTMGWQQDPFGHSYTHAWIMASMGLEGMMLSRIDFQEQSTMMPERKLQFMWQLPHNKTLFTMVLYQSYVAPPSFQYDFRWTRSEYDKFKRTGDFNKPGKKKSFDLTYWLRNVSYHYETDELAYSIGHDYTYLDAEFSFTAYDEYLKHVGENSEKLKSTMDYIRADDFMKIINKKSEFFQPHKENDDFFPYRDDRGAYWTGYFTSHPYLKKLTMDNGRLLQKLKNYFNLDILQPEIPKFYTNLTDNNNTDFKNVSQSITHVQQKLLKFEQTVAALQHHDAVTGTCKDHVAQDYKDRVVNSRQKVIDILEKIATLKGVQELENLDFISANSLKFEFCVNDQYKNELCSLNLQKMEKISLINIQNFQANSIKKITQIQISNFEEGFHILNLKTKQYQEGEIICLKNECTLYFEVELLPYTNNYYLIHQNDGETKGKGVKILKNIQENTNIIQQGDQSLKYEKNYAHSFVYERNNTKYQFSFDLKKYKGGWSNNGAYLFSTKQDKAENYQLLSDFSQFQVFQGLLVSCLVFKVQESQFQFILRKDTNFVHIQTFLQSMRDKIEVVLNIDVKDFQNNENFQTDSNGLFRMDRTLYKSQKKGYKTESDSQDKISGNIYPVSKFLTIKDEAQKKRVTILNDRTQGGSSLSNGNIQLVIQRQTQSDDARGVQQALYDQSPYIYDHYLMFEATEDEERQVQYDLDLKEEIFHAQQTSNGQISDFNFDNDTQDWVQKFMKNIPKYVKFNIKYLNKNEFLIRFQNMYENKSLSLNLNDLLQKSSLDLVYESNLQGTRSWDEISSENVQFYSKNDTNKANGSSKNHYKNTNYNNMVILPLEIRSFRINSNKKEFSQKNGKMGEEIWNRKETREQKFCDDSCYQDGICVWDTCKCLGSWGDKCENSCQDDKCLYCLGNQGEQCLSCQEGYQMKHFKCVLNCQKGYYFDDKENKCEKCDDNCFECEGNKSSCTVCYGNKELFQNKCLSMECDLNITPNCRECNIFKECLLCNLGYSKQKNQFNITECIKDIDTSKNNTNNSNSNSNTTYPNQNNTHLSNNTNSNTNVTNSNTNNTTNINNNIGLGDKDGESNVEPAIHDGEQNKGNFQYKQKDSSMVGIVIVLGCVAFIAILFGVFQTIRYSRLLKQRKLGDQQVDEESEINSFDRGSQNVP